MILNCQWIRPLILRIAFWCSCLLMDHIHDSWIIYVNVIRQSTVPWGLSRHFSWNRKAIFFCQNGSVSKSNVLKTISIVNESKSLFQVIWSLSSNFRSGHNISVYWKKPTWCGEIPSITQERSVWSILLRSVLNKSVRSKEKFPMSWIDLERSRSTVDQTDADYSAAEFLDWKWKSGIEMFLVVLNPRLQQLANAPAWLISR